jgi:hypothetical protein
MSRTHFDGPLASGNKQAGTPGGANVGLAVLSQTYVFLVTAAAPVPAIINLPPGSQILEITPDTLAAFNGATATLSAGNVPGGPQYFAALDVKASARAVPVLTGAAILAMADIGTNTALHLTLTPGAGNTQGTLLVTVNYVQKG